MLGRHRQRPQWEGHERGRGWWPPSVHTQTYSPDLLAEQSDSVGRPCPHKFSIETEIPGQQQNVYSIITTGMYLQCESKCTQ